jgi:hypothetical protein
LIGTATNAATPTPSSTPSASLVVAQADTVRAVVSLHGCPAGPALAANGPAGYALRQSLAAASGVPVSDVVLLGARCSGSATSYVAFLPTDPINTYLPPSGGSLRLLSEAGGGTRVVAGARTLQVDSGGSALIDTQVTVVASDPAGLAPSSTGLGVIPSLSAASNVAARIAAMTGTVPASVAALNSSLMVNATSLGASLSAVASAWAAATGQDAADVSFGVQSVAAGDASSASASRTSVPLAVMVAPPVVGGAMLAVAAVALWRRTRVAPPAPAGGKCAARLRRTPSRHDDEDAAGVVVVENNGPLVASEASVVLSIEDPIAA